MTSLRIPRILIALSLTTAPLWADDGAEPPVVYTLEIDGQTVSLAPDVPQQIEGNFANPKVTLRVAKTRTLQAAGVAFSYPAYFTFEADTSDPDMQVWTAEGKDVTLILFNFSEPVDPLMLAESTAEELKALDVQIEPVKMTLGDAERTGVKSTITLLGQKVMQHVLTLPPTDKGSRLLVVQEVREEGKPEAAELGATLKLVASSLSITPE